MNPRPSSPSGSIPMKRLSGPAALSVHRRRLRAPLGRRADGAGEGHDRLPDRGTHDPLAAPGHDDRRRQRDRGRGRRARAAGGRDDRRAPAPDHGAAPAHQLARPGRDLRARFRVAPGRRPLRRRAAHARLRRAHGRLGPSRERDPRSHLRAGDVHPPARTQRARGRGRDERRARDLLSGGPLPLVHGHVRQRRRVRNGRRRDGTVHDRRRAGRGAAGPASGTAPA